MKKLKELIEKLYPINATLVGEGYDERLKILQKSIDLKVFNVASGTQLGTWTVPNAWKVNEAWVKFKGEKIIDYAVEPMSLVTYSLPFNGTVSKEELVRHLHWHDELGDATAHKFKFYDRDWGFCVPKNQLKETEMFDKLEEGDYEVFIDVEEKPGVMKLGIHTIKGKSDREIVLLAHLDHPFQANDNLSGVACLTRIAELIKADHTVKIVFCPETVGSMAYIYTQDISKVDFVIAVDICGNDNTIMVQKAWDPYDKLNRVAHCALQVTGNPYRKVGYRGSIGSDESPFNDPQLKIPGLCLTTAPYKEYHSSLDTPEIINYDKIAEVGDLILKIIEVWEKDFIPKRKFKGMLMRSRYGMQSPSPQLNLNYEYLFYHMDGKRSLAELCAELELPFDKIYEDISKIEADGQITRVDPGQKPIRSVTPKKYKGLRG